jgi:hypothetical protein
MCLIRSGTTLVPSTYYPAFTNSRVLDHNNLTMGSLLSPFRTPLPYPSSPIDVSPLLRLCSPPPNSVISILGCFRTHSDPHSCASWLVATESPFLLFASIQVRWQKPVPSHRPLPVPALLRLQFHIFEFVDIPFHRCGRRLNVDHSTGLII